MPRSRHRPPNLASNPNHSLPNFASNRNPHHSLPNLASNPNPRQTPTRITAVASSSSSLPTMKITADSLSQLLHLGSSSCSICLEDFSVSQKINQLPCKHIFHRHCIASWLKRSKTCPLCRCKVSAVSRPIQQSQGRDSGNFRELLQRGFRWLYSTDPSAHVDHLHYPESVVYGGANSHRVLNVNVNVNLNLNVNVNVNVDPMLDADSDTLMLDADVDTMILDADGDTLMLDA